MATTLFKPISFSLFIILLLATFPTPSLSVVPEECNSESGKCVNKDKALPLKLIAIAVIFLTSMIGVGSPLLTRSFKALSPEKSLFVVLKAFASGIILGTGFMHVLPDSYDMLSSNCLPETPWHKFPFTGFVAMYSAIFTLMVDSLATSMYTKKNSPGVLPEKEMVERSDEEARKNVGHLHGHHHNLGAMEGGVRTQLLRYKVVAMVLEMGIIVHSVVIGLSMGSSNNICSIKPLIAALCFHQMFEGMGLGGCILQAEYKLAKKLAMVFFFAVTTPFGIVLGIALSKTYRENSPTSLIVTGLLNGSSAGLLIYMALVDLLSAEFMSKKLQGNIKLQLTSFVAVSLGAGFMAVMALWA